MNKLVSFLILNGCVFDFVAAIMTWREASIRSLTIRLRNMSMLIIPTILMELLLVLLEVVSSNSSSFQVVTWMVISIILTILTTMQRSQTIIINIMQHRIIIFLVNNTCRITLHFTAKHLTRTLIYLNSNSFSILTRL